MGATKTETKISRAKSICRDDAAQPGQHFQEAERLTRAISERTIPAIRAVIARYENHSDEQLRDRAEKLQLRFDRAKIRWESQLEESRLKAAPAPVVSTETPAPDATSTADVDSITGIELLPPDGDDGWWDGEIYEKTRRDIVGIALGLPPFLPYTRQQVVDTLAARFKCPASELEFHSEADNPPWTHSWLPVASVRGAEQNPAINGQL